MMCLPQDSYLSVKSDESGEARPSLEGLNMGGDSKILNHEAFKKLTAQVEPGEVGDDPKNIQQPNNDDDHHHKI